MRLGLMVYGSLQELSGGFRYDRRLTEELEALGHSVSVIALPWRPYARALLDNLNRSLLVRIANLDVDALLQDELCHPSLFSLNRRLRAMVRTPTYGIVHHLRSIEDHPVPLAAFYRWIERRYLSTLDGFVFNSLATRRSVERLLGSDVSGVVAYPGRDQAPMDDRRQNGAGPKLPPEPLRVLYVGSLIRRKGLDLLLDALAQVPGSGWQLDIAGRADLEPAYAVAIRRRLARVPYKDRAFYHGKVSPETLHSLYRRADLLAVPSRHEGFGMVYLEAMGYGLPVVAGAAGGASEFVEEGIHGALIDPGDVSQIVRALRGYLKQPGRLHLHGEAARRRFWEHPDWRDSAQAVARYLQARPHDRRPNVTPRGRRQVDPPNRRRSTA